MERVAATDLSTGTANALRPSTKARNWREVRLCQDIVRYLSVTLEHTAIIIHVPNEGQRNVRAGAVLRSMGLLPGCPDYLIVHDGHVYAFEVKAARGYPTKLQRDVMARFEAASVPCAVVRSVDDVQRFLEPYGVLRQHVLF